MELDVLEYYPTDDFSLDVGEEEPEKLPETTSLTIYNPLKRYLEEIRRFPMLTKEEEFQLAVAYREDGDLKAAYRLITSHLILVVRIALFYNRIYGNLLDLIQEGNVGLIEAVKRFDPHRGVRLSTYAAWWVRAFILKFIMDNWRLVRVGTTNERRKLLYNLKKEKAKLEAMGYSAHPKLLATHLKVGESDVIAVEQSLNLPEISIDAPIDSDPGKSYHEILPSNEPSLEETLAHKEFKDLLNEKIKDFSESLTKRDRYILKERLLAEDPASLQEIGDKFNITREAIRQAEKKLMGKLKTYLQHQLSDALDIQFQSS